MKMQGYLLLEVSILLILLVVLRFVYLMYKVSTGQTAYIAAKRHTPAKTIICMGSGGHTTEMLRMLKMLDFRKYHPRYYVIASNDRISIPKINEIEPEKDYNIISIPRSRRVGQSYPTSVITTLYSTLVCVPYIIKIKPDLILCNGPGACIPICIIAFVIKAAFICNTRIVFIESYCRTRTFSLTARILVYIADNIIVQWPSLKCKLKRATYIGQLI